MKRMALLAIVVVAVLATASVALAENGPKFGVTGFGVQVTSGSVRK